MQPPGTPGPAPLTTCPWASVSPALLVEGKTDPSLVPRPTSKSGDDLGGQESGLPSCSVASKVPRPRRTQRLWTHLHAASLG